jgi:hypothetical protein
MPKKYSPSPAQAARNVALRKEKRKNDDYRESANQLERERWARLSLEKKARKNALRIERRKSEDYRKREAQLSRESHARLIARMSPEELTAYRLRKRPSPEKRIEYNQRWRQKMSPERKRLLLDRAKEQRKNNPERIAKQRRRSLERLYGLSMEAFNALLLKQGGCCAICRTNAPGGKRNWQVDHSHSAGHIRGLLCHNCNLLLGHACDSIEVLGRAIVYLAITHLRDA